MTPEAIASLDAEFVGQPIEEKRAAILVQTFTGDAAHLEDANGRQGAVDLTLGPPGQVSGIVEVTSTLDAAFQRNSAQLVRLVEQVDHLYVGDMAWALGLEYGWSMPTNRDIGQLASELATELLAAESRLEILGGRESVAVGEHVSAYLADLPQSRGVSLSSWSTNTPNSPDLPYLDLLSRYLSTSDLIARKISKLITERTRLGSSRQHLYLLMASTGRHAGLLPATPSVFTWGTFVCPDPVTDVWIDAGTGTLYHWDAHRGWVYHDLDS